MRKMLALPARNLAEKTFDRSPGVFEEKGADKFSGRGERMNRINSETERAGDP